LGYTYAWHVTKGMIVGSSTDSVMQVMWDTTGIGSVSVTLTNASGCDSTVVKITHVRPTPLPVMSGPDSVCAYKQSVYSVSSCLSCLYHWSITGGTVTGSVTDTLIRPVWGSSGSGSVTITVTNLLGCDSTVAKAINIHPTPVPHISGPDSVCEYKQTVFSTSSGSGYTYAWSVAGGSVVGSSTDTIVHILWGIHGSGSVTVTQTNSYGCDSVISRSIIINPTPVPVISGPGNVCEHKQTTFSIPFFTGYYYLWSVTGGVIQDSASGNIVHILWSSHGSGSVVLTQTNSFGCDSTVTKPIVINPTPVTVINGPDSVCEHQQTVFYASFVAGYQYSWLVSGGTILGSATDTIIHILWGTHGGGSVMLSETNSYGCDSSLTRQIIINPTPVPVIVGVDSVCEHKTYTYHSGSAVAGNTLLWTISGGAIYGNTSDSVVNVVWGVQGAGTIRLKQTSASGCDSLVQKNVIIKPTPVPKVSGPSTVCAHKNAIYKATPFIASHQYNWIISGGIINTILSDTEAHVTWGAQGAGSIRVTEVNALGCDSTDTLHVTIQPTPVPVLTGPSIACERKSYIYKVKSVPAHTYAWNVTGGSASQLNDTMILVYWTAAGSGTVSVHETNAQGCDSIVSFAVTIHATPTPVISGPALLCAYTSAVYTSPVNAGSAYQWTVTGGTIVGPSNVSVARVLWGNAGNGTLSVRETNILGCDSTVSFNVTIKSRPIPHIKGSTITCAGPTVYYYTDTTSIFAGETYFWETDAGTILSGSSSSQISVQWPTPGNHLVRLTKTNPVTNCDSIVILPVYVDSVIKPVLSANTFTGCIPLSVVFRGNTPIPGYKYLWDFGDGDFSTNANPSYVYLTPGTFVVKLIVQNANGCKDSIWGQTIVNSIPKADFNYTFQHEKIYADEDTVIFANHSVGGNLYTWDFDGSMDTIYGTQKMYRSPGFYDVYLTTIDTLTGCKSTVKKTLEVWVREALYIPNAFTPNNDGVNDYFFASVLNVVEFEIIIFNRWGEILFKSNDINFKWDGNFQGAPAQVDVYGYLVTGTGYHGKHFYETGTVTLLR
jgi:gliding motility-associated-like protein